MTAPAAPPSLSYRLAAEIDRDRRERIDRLGAEPVAWLALAPAWTHGAAVAAGFPAVEEFVRDAVAAGWCVAEQRRLDRRSASRRARVLTEVARALPAETRAELRDRVCGHALGVLEGIASEASRATLLAQLAPALTGGRREQAVRAARAIGGEGHRLAALAALSTDAPLRAEVRAGLDALPPEDRVRVAAALAPHGPAHWADVIDAALACPEPYAELSELAGRLPADRLAHAVQILEGSRVAGDPAERATVLAAAAAQLPGALADTLRAALEEELLSVHPSAAALILVDLAAAAAARGRRDDAIRLVERILDDPLRLQAYAVVLRAAGPAAAGLADRAVRVGSQAAEPDLDGCAAVLEVLAERGLIDRAGPLLSVLERAISRPEAVGPLSRTAAALTLAGRERAGVELARIALSLAVENAGPAARAAALLQVIPAVGPDLAPGLAAMVGQDARKLADAAASAALLARALPFLAAEEAAGALAELLVLTAPTGDDAAFWMPDAVRPQVLAALTDSRGADWLRGTAARIGERLLTAPADRLPMPANLRRWATLAAAADEALGAAAARRLESVCEPLLRSGTIGEALGWVDVARLLLPVVAGQLETSVLLMARRAELAQRREQDRRHLDRFLVRDEQVRAFEELLAEPDDGRWALHYLGQGGIGKTSLLRYLTARLAPERDVITTRVDFDHLDPEYPLRRPGQLLLELLQELGAHAESGPADILYRRVDQQLRDLQYWPPESDPLDALAALDSPSMLDAVADFCDYLRQLPRRAVLVLDTCEEVAKFQPQSGRMPQLVAMFTLLERIHGAVPSVRVVFAGRRPLHHADGGAPPGRAARLPAGKGYLRVEVVRGFTGEEAARYVTGIAGLSLEATELAALLALCPEAVPRVYDALPGDDPGDSRFGPFDLAQHTAALQEDPGYLATATSGAGIDPYVENRILRRLRGPARGLLAAVVALRRFDREMLAAGADLGPDQLAAAWFELAATEWLEYRVHPPLDTPFLEVDRSLLERLGRYYEQYPQRGEYEQARRVLGRRLPAMVAGRDLDRLRVEHVDAALRCAPPGEAAALCHELALRVMGEQAWGWTQTVFARVLGAEGALADATHPAAGSARALYAAALGKVSAGTNLLTFWSDVAESVEYADTAVAAWLRLRTAHALIIHGGTGSPTLADVLAATMAGLPAGELAAAEGDAEIRALAVAFRGGRPVVVTGDAGGTVRLWDLDSAAALTPPRRAHAGAVQAVAVIDLGGRPVAMSGGADGCVRWWAVDPGPAVDLPVLHDGGPIAALPVTVMDGEPVVVVAQRDGIRVWRPGTPSGLARRLPAGMSPVSALAAAGEGGTPELAVATGPVVTRFDLATLTPVGPPLTGSASAVSALAYALVDGQYVLVSGAADGARAQHLGEGTERRFFDDGMLTYALAAGGTLLASAGTDGAVRLWDVPTGEVRRVLRGGPGAVLDCAVAPDGSWVASAGGDDTVHIWDAVTGQLRRILTGHQGGVWGCTAAPDGTWLASADGNGVLRVWDLPVGRLRWESPVRPGGLRRCAVAPDGSWIAGAGADGSVSVWDAATGELRHSLGGHVGGAWDCAVAPDGTWLASTAGDGVVRLWDARTGRAVRELTGHLGPVFACVIAPDGRWLASTGNDGTVRIWEPGTGKERETRQGHTAGVWSCAVAPDGSWLATGGWEIRIWAGESRRTLRPLPGGETVAVTAVATGRLGDRPVAVTGGADGSVRVWDLRSAAPLGAPLSGHVGPVTAVLVTEIDGDTVTVTGGADGTVRRWNLSEGWQRARLLLGDALATTAVLLDRVEESGQRPYALGVGRDQLAELERLASAVGAGAFALMLRARAAYLSGDPDEADRYAREALDTSPEGDGVDPYLGADWDVPVHVSDRVRLEVARLPGTTPPAFPAVLPARAGEADHDRLAAAMMLRELDTGPIPAGALEGIHETIRDVPVPEPTILAHRVVPPLRVVLARAFAALGDADRARLCVARGQDRGPAGRAALDAARLDVARTFRRSDWERHQRGGDATATDPAVALLEPVQRLLPVEPDRPFTGTGDAHRWWRTRMTVTLDGPGKAACAGVLRQVPGGGSPEALLSATATFDDAAYALDFAEASLIAGKTVRVVRLSPFEPRAWWWHHRTQPEEAARLALRHAALTSAGGPKVTDLSWLHPAVGRRRLAEIALEEGELLQLRAAEPAGALLLWAADWFGECGDWFGRLRAEIVFSLLNPGRSELLHDRYEAAQRRRSDLPRWQRVEAAARRGADPVRLFHPEWGGWLQRLALALTPADQVRELLARLGVSPADAPYELARAAGAAYLAEAANPRVETITDEPEPSQVIRRRLVAAAGYATECAAGLVVCWATVSGSGTAARVAAYVVAGLGFALVLAYQLTLDPPGGGWRWSFTNWRRPPHRLEIAVTADDDGIAMTINAWWSDPRAVLRESVKPDFDLRATGAGAFAEVPRWPRRGGRRAQLAIFAARRRLRPLPVRLTVDPTVSGLAWEVMLIWAGGGELDIRRTGPGAVPPGRPARFDGRWVVWAGRRWVDVIAESLPADRPVVQPAGTAAALSAPAVGDGDLLVVAGLALHTPAGLRISVPGLTGTAGPPLALDPDDVPLARLPLVLVIAEPNAVDSRPPGGLRADAMLRARCGELAAAGAPAVLFLPGMPAVVLRRALIVIARSLDDDPDVARAAALARQELRAVLPADADLPAELTLYLHRTP